MFLFLFCLDLPGNLKIVQHFNLFVNIHMQEYAEIMD